MKKPKPVWIICHFSTGHIPSWNTTFYHSRAEAEAMCASEGRAVKFVPAPTTKKRKAKKR